MAQEAPIFVADMPMRWGDMDAFGHVNNTVYFRYMEQARFAWLEQHGGTLPQGEGPVLVHTQCTFLQQLRYPETLEVRIFVEAVGRSSMETRYDMVGKDNRTLYAQGTAKVVWLSFTQGKSIPLPDALRTMLAPGS